MTADELRRAATKVRELAEAATPGPWLADVLGSEGYAVREAEGKPRPGSRIPRPVRVARCGYEDWDTDKGNAEYIAAMHPAVGLALACMLDNAAEDVELREPGGELHGHFDMTVTVAITHALAVARQILGEA